MNTPPVEVAELANLVEEVSGNVVLPGHYPFLAETAWQRAHALGLDGLSAYVRALVRGGLPGEWGWLLPHITIKESFLFRTPQHFAALSATVLPRLAAARERKRRLLLWSAGCARGEEPATLAVVLAEQALLAGWEWHIVATDVDEEALAAARGGRFGQRAVAHVPCGLLAKHFTRQGESYELNPDLRRRIEYRVLNLVDEPFPMPAEPFDLVFLRNVLIYFRADSQRRVAAAVAQALAPDGFLFLGPAETLWQLSQELEPVDLDDCFCYRHRAATQPGERGLGSGAQDVAPDEREALAPAAIERASRADPDVELVTASAPRAASGLSEPKPATRSPDPGPVGTRERLQAAARKLAENRLAEACRLVDEALLADPADPAAHALEGLLHDIAGRTQMAFASYRAALFLDSGLFQVRLLLADALRRLGEERRAAHEYREVMATISGGKARQIEVLAGLPLADGAQALRRCRKALGAV